MPPLSIIVPTHERFRYARQTIRAILDLSDQIEVVVSDTSAVDPWSDFVRDNPARRLKIVRPGSGISVVDNFNVALSQATGRYMCFIGDDDLVTPQIIDLALWGQDHGVDAIRPTFPVLFYWPDYRHRVFPEAYAGTIWARPFSGSIAPLDPVAARDNAARNLGRGVFAMPRAYCGLVSRDLVERVIAQHGALFGGVSPDIYSAALLSTHARNAVEIDFPVIVPGASGASTAGQSAAGQHVGALRDNDHIRPFGKLEWHPHVPEFYSVPTVWAYSLVRALEQIGPDAVAQANWGRLYAQCILYHARYRTHVMAAMRRHAKDAGRRAALIGSVGLGLARELAWGLGRLASRYRSSSGTTQPSRVAEASDVDQAINAVSSFTETMPSPAWLARP